MFLMKVSEFGWCVCRWSRLIFRGCEFYDIQYSEFFLVLSKDAVTDEETAEAKLRELDCE